MIPRLIVEPWFAICKITECDILPLRFVTRYISQIAIEYLVIFWQTKLGYQCQSFLVNFQSMIESLTCFTDSLGQSVKHGLSHSAIHFTSLVLHRIALEDILLRFCANNTLVSMSMIFSQWQSFRVLEIALVLSVKHGIGHCAIPSFRHSVIPPFRHSVIPPFRHSAIPSFRHSVIPPFRHSAIPSFRHSVIPPFRIPCFTDSQNVRGFTDKIKRNL